MANFLPDKVIKSLDAYKGDSYGEINSSLRESLFDGIDPDIKNHIENKIDGKKYMVLVNNCDDYVLVDKFRKLN